MNNEQREQQMMNAAEAYAAGLYADENDVVIDPCAGSGSTLLAAWNLNRRAYGFEIKKDFFKLANEKVLTHKQPNLFPTL